MTLPRGFRSAGLAAGLKPSGRPDLALLAADGPLDWAFVGTRNRLSAACVDRTRRLLAAGAPVRAVIMNAGNANCATGAQGAKDDEALAALAAGALGDLDPDQVLTASTGVIGVPMPMDTVRAAVPRVAAALGQGVEGLSQAILTTDTRAKVAEATLPGGARVVGVAKGSGMIHPDMGTMLAFVATDADLPAATLRQAWPEVAARTFNQVTVDGDTSPNDMALLLSSRRVNASEASLLAALEQVAAELAERIAADGEGASTLIRVHVRGAARAGDALAAARTVAGSALVKTAVHGRDPNWGRILSSLGRSGADFDPRQAEIVLQGTTVYRGQPLDFDAAALSAALDADVVEIEADLGAGSAEGRAWGCDLTDGYVRINADYTT
ncbi:MAG: bifunctional glutamate N-acetyltransferase/amino-acid acetyltransferase ArgJ [Trueperaceae bacterium]|nr:bifunctional glutamate N-acetyltransferase/amino-acid acetyltransferase ArgJ [Trueperaceae bacterium]